MTKIAIRLLAVGALLMFSACATVQDANYKLYKTRLQAQSYVSGKRLKPLPHPRARVRRISNRNQQYCPPANNRAKRKVLKGAAYKAKSRQHKRKATVRRAKTVYRAKPRVVARRYVAPRKAKVVYRARPRPAARKYVAPRRAKAVYRARPRPVARKYVAPRRAKAVYRPRPVARRYVAPPRAVVQPRRPAPQAVAPRIPLSQLNDGLFAAAKGGNVAHMTNLLAQGVQVNAKNGSGETALHAAAALGRAGAVGLLLQKGANPNARTTGGWTPLHSAARFRHAQVARMLVGRGASVNVRNNQGKTALALAEQVGARATVSTLKGLGGH